MGTARIEALGVRYYGALVESRGVDVLAASAAAGVLRPILSSGVSIVNARAAAAPAASTSSNRAARARGISPVSSRSSCTTDAGERWVEGTVFEPNSPRLVSVRGVDVEAPLGGTMVIIANDDQPGVIGEVGTILGRHRVNIANFALGRGDGGAIGVVNVDEDDDARTARWTDAVEELRRVPADPRSVGRPTDRMRNSELRLPNPEFQILNSELVTATSERARMDAHAEPWCRPGRLAVDVKGHRPIGFDRRVRGSRRMVTAARSAPPCR